MNNLSHEGERIAFIEFTKSGEPYQVFTLAPGEHWRMYDIEFSRNEGLFLIDHSGGGPPHLSGPGLRYWASPEVDLAQVDVLTPSTGRPSGKRPNRKLRVPDGERIGAAGLPKKKWFPVTELEYFVQDTAMEYCLHCNDWFATNDNWSGVLCRHVSWCDGCGMWSSPQQRCRCDKRQPAKELARE